MHCVRWYCDALGETAGPMNAKEDTLTTEVRTISTAQVALAATRERVYRHTPSIVKTAHEFVTHHQRRYTEAGRDDAVQFTAADARSFYMYQDFIRLRVSVMNVENLDDSRAGKYQRLHFDLNLALSCTV